MLSRGDKKDIFCPLIHAAGWNSLLAITEDNPPLYWGVKNADHSWFYHVRPLNKLDRVYVRTRFLHPVRKMILDMWRYGCSTGHRCRLPLLELISSNVKNDTDHQLRITFSYVISDRRSNYTLSSLRWENCTLYLVVIHILGKDLSLRTLTDMTLF